MLNYADDTIPVIRNAEDLVLGALEKNVKNACRGLLISFASESRNIPIYDKEIIPDSIEIYSSTIMRQTEVKLKFNKHVDNVCKNAARQINIMHRFKCIFDLLESKTIYNNSSAF